MEHQFHFGKKFYLDKKTGYWISTTLPKIRAHPYVWKYFYGEIPKGFHIHHKDKNKSNNFIDNLEIIEASKHLSLHSLEPKNRERATKWAELIRPLTKKWHRSQDGKIWHKEHAIKCNFGKNEFKEFTCLKCNSLYKTRKLIGSKFCSNKCKSAMRRSLSLDNIIKKCLVCAVEFSVNKYSKSKTCGRKCGGIFKSKEYKERWN